VQTIVRASLAGNFARQMLLRQYEGFGQGLDKAQILPRQDLKIFIKKQKTLRTFVSLRLCVKKSL
jgi:hypothetical protein